MILAANPPKTKNACSVTPSEALVFERFLRDPGITPQGSIYPTGTRFHLLLPRASVSPSCRQLVCSIPTLGSAREQAAAQEGAEGLAGVGFLLALAEALGELSAGPSDMFLHIVFVHSNF